MNLQEVLDHNRRVPVPGYVSHNLGAEVRAQPHSGEAGKVVKTAEQSTTFPPLLNKTETRFRNILLVRGYYPVLEQAITLRLDPPFKSYRPDLVVFDNGRPIFWEVKAPHRFARAGIAKAACAAKTYPRLKFQLAMWTKDGWKESVLTP